MVGSIVYGILALFVSQAMASGTKTICTMTINSDDEKKVFQSNIKDKNIKYVELVDTNNRNWLEDACASKVQCDTLIISGHFGGAFFGSTGERVSLDTLEKLSCSKTCDGILKSPKEVYLFGCNTLAEKSKDTRTPGQYRQVLLADGIAPDVADRIVAARYSPIGDSFKARMQKVFAGVPQIYGFDSIGPAGKTVRPFLNKYLSSLSSSYSERLDQLEAAKVISSIDGGNKAIANFSNNWNTALQGTARASCSGAKDFAKKECGLFDPKLNTFEKLTLTKELLNSPERLSHMGVVESYLRELDFTKLSSDEKSVLSEISKNHLAKKVLISAVDALDDSPSLKWSLVNLGSSLNWYSKEDTQKKIRAFIGSRLAAGPTRETNDFICGLAVNLPISASDIPESFYTSHDGLRTLGCMGPRDSKIHSKIVDQLSSSDSYLREELIRALRGSHEISYETVDKVLSYSDDQNSIVRAYVASFIGDAGANRKSDQQRLLQFIKDSDNLVQGAALDSLRKIKPTDEAVLMKVAEGLKGDKISVLYDGTVKFFQEIKPKNQKVIEAIKKSAPDIINW